MLRKPVQLRLDSGVSRHFQEAATSLTNADNVTLARKTMSGSASRSKHKQGILHALLPGARLDKNTNKILVHTGLSNEVVKFNVGGSIYETYKSTLRAIPSSPLSNDQFLARHFRPAQKEYFFDRDPEIFHCVLNYFRTGELHLPTSVCGPVVKSELEFWGVDEVDIEECCWSRYATWATTLQALRKLEEDRKEHFQLGEYPEQNSPSDFRELRRRAWKFFAQPSSSPAAKMYGIFSLTVIFLSIFSFCANTHTAFQVEDMRAGQRLQNDTGEDSSIKMVAHPALHYLDVGCLIFFVLELITRFLVSPNKVKFILMPMTIIEFMALLPDVVDNLARLLSATYTEHQKIVWFISFMKLLRVFRIFRLMRHIPGLWILFYTLKASIKDLLLLLLFVFVGMLVFSSLIFFAEHSSQANFSSIPKCFWWAVITMTTVGYGDMAPETSWGYLIGTATSICGVLMIGFTVPVLVNNFVMYYNHTTSTIRREEERARVAHVKKHARVYSSEQLRGCGLGEKLMGLGSLKSLKAAFECKDTNDNVKPAEVSLVSASKESDIPLIASPEIIVSVKTEPCSERDYL